MPGPAKAFQTEIVDVGLFTNPSDGAAWIDYRFTVVVVGADGTLERGTLQAAIDPGLMGAQVDAVIADAVRTFATGKSYTLAPNAIFLLAFNRV